MARTQRRIRKCLNYASCKRPMHTNPKGEGEFSIHPCEFFAGALKLYRCRRHDGFCQLGFKGPAISKAQQRVPHVRFMFKPTLGFSSLIS